MVVIVTLFFLASILPVLVAPATVTISDSPAYETQRPCAKLCWFNAVNRVASAISCDDDPAENDCFCRADLQNDAKAFIKDCVSMYCDGKTLDIDLAVGLYTDYCTSNGYTTPVVTARPTPTGTQDPQTVTVTVIRTTTLVAAANHLQAPLAVLAAHVTGFLR
jgi:hypothetical protein